MRLFIWIGKVGSYFGADRFESATVCNSKPILGGWQGYPQQKMLQEGKILMKRIMKKLGSVCLLAISGVFLLAGTGFCYDINDKLSIGGIIAGVWQYQSLSDAPKEFENEGRGLVLFEPEVSFTPTDSDELFVKFGFGAGNGLDGGGQSPFMIPPWGGNVEGDYKDINGRNRDYLLTAWYKHTFSFSEDHTLGLTGGIIDATDYMDENAFANDEYTQFMNAALVNGPHSFLPSFDIGGVVEWDLGAFSVRGVAMALGSNGEEGDFEEPYNFYGVQFGYSVDFGLGEGNYRVILDGTSNDFSNVAANQKERLSAVAFSFDQQLGGNCGALASVRLSER